MTKKVYDKMYGSHSDAVYVHTLDKIKWCNQKGARLLGYDNPKEVIGRSPFEFATDQQYIDIALDAGTSTRGASQPSATGTAGTCLYTSGAR